MISPLHRWAAEPQNRRTIAPLIRSTGEPRSTANRRTIAPLHRSTTAYSPSRCALLRPCQVGPDQIGPPARAKYSRAAGETQSRCRGRGARGIQGWYGETGGARTPPTTLCVGPALPAPVPGACLVPSARPAQSKGNLGSGPFWVALVWPRQPALALIPPPPAAAVLLVHLIAMRWFCRPPRTPHRSMRLDSCRTTIDVTVPIQTSRECCAGWGQPTGNYRALCCAWASVGLGPLGFLHDQAVAAQG